jgi:Zn-dependent protease with chaperone function
VCFREALLIMFQQNKSEYYTDPVYSMLKNSHPTLQERLDAVEKLKKK